MRELLDPRLAQTAEQAQGFEVVHPELLTRREFTQLQRALKRKGQGPRPRAGWKSYPLSGRIVCPCGGRWIGAGEFGPSNRPKAERTCRFSTPSDWS